MKFEFWKSLRRLVCEPAPPAVAKALHFDKHLLHGAGDGDVLLLITDRLFNEGQREQLRQGVLEAIESSAPGLKVIVLEGGWRAQLVSGKAKLTPQELVPCNRH